MAKINNTILKNGIDDAKEILGLNENNELIFRYK
jgi:hypothetical protein